MIYVSSIDLARSINNNAESTLNRRIKKSISIRQTQFVEEILRIEDWSVDLGKGFESVFAELL
jgi:hypothetical protein